MCYQEMKKRPKIDFSKLSMPKELVKKVEVIKDFIRTNPYSRLARFDKPAGIYLVLLPALWAVAFAAHNIWSMLFYFFVMTLGAIVVRGAGCIINDLWDIEIDKKVTRTKSRPLASGELRKIDAYQMLAALGVLSLMVLLTLPKLSIFFGLLAIIPIIIYPTMKRYNYYPQVFLGMVFNMGVFIAWFAVDPQITLMPFILYAAAAIWTVCYDTIYAHQDIKDDKKAGVKSLAILLGDRTVEVVWKMYQVLALILFIVGLNMHMGILFYLIAAFGAYHLYWQTETLDIKDPKSCAEKFNSNVHFGMIILAAIVIGRF
jgi:4-hydroxybenzoate polyprenyltransferase